MTIRYEDLLFAYDFDTTFVERGITFLKDWGPLRCHLPLTGAGAPNPPTRTNAIDGVSYAFNGTNQYLQMGLEATARFWSAIPEGHPDFTFIGKFQWTVAGNFDPIFFASNAATAGIFLRHAVAERSAIQAYNAAAALVGYSDNANVPLSGRTRTMVFSTRFSAGAPVAHHRLYDGSLTVAGTATATGVPVFDRTVQPLIGRNPAGTAYWGAGRMYYLAAAKTIPGPREAERYSAALMDGIYKPWCVR